MTVYLIANLNIRDRARYGEYEAGFMEIFNGHNGTLLAVDEQQEILEGDYDFTRTVLISFPSHEDAKAWYESEPYQALAEHRWASSDGSAILIQDLSA